MKNTTRRAIFASTLIPISCSVLPLANATDSKSGIAHFAAVYDGTITSGTRRVPLNLRVPPLQRVMSQNQLLAEIDSSSDEAESIEVLAGPELLPMASDAQAPLGIIDSLRWSKDHPKQVWRILLPATNAP